MDHRLGKRAVDFGRYEPVAGAPVANDLRAAPALFRPGDNRIQNMPLYRYGASRGHLIDLHQWTSVISAPTILSPPDAPIKVEEGAGHVATRATPALQPKGNQ